jgi:uncharacterized membrane protein
MKNTLKSNWPSLGLILISIGVALAMIGALPAQIPIHFDVAGNPDGYTSKVVAMAVLPSIALLVVFLVPGLLKISPQGYTAEQSVKSVARLNFAIVAFLMIIYFASLREAVEPGLWIHRAVPVGLAVLTLLLGNYFGKIEQNFVVGFRLPWTLASTNNWRQTHRFAGKIHVASGAVSLVWALINPIVLVPVLALVVASSCTIVFSYRLYKKENRSEKYF